MNLFDKLFIVYVIAISVVSLSVLGFLGWVIINLLKHFGVI